MTTCVAPRSAQIIDGRALAKAQQTLLTQQLQEDLRLQKDQRQRESLSASLAPPGLAILCVGEDAASKIYVHHKLKMAAHIGITAQAHSLPATITAQALLERIHSLNTDAAVHGIIVQLPLPPHLSTELILQAIAPHKDVDGLHPLNLGKLCMNAGADTGTPVMRPCTPQGCLDLIMQTIPCLQGKHAVIVGRSALVGKPLGLLLLNADCTVTFCHSLTKNLGEQTRRADILIAAVGKPHLITADMIKPGAVVIDVGISKKEGRLVGDVDFDAARMVAGAITPVPGGVGPMTVIHLMRNTMTAWKSSRAIVETPGL